MRPMSTPTSAATTNQAATPMAIHPNAVMTAPPGEVRIHSLLVTQETHL
jgi:hypothetical protein